MGDAKAMLESIVRQMGATYGRLKKVRVNAISQSFIYTSASAHWDQGGHYRKYTEAISPLGSASADDCADLCVALFSDLTKKVTMQTIHNDGGLSQTLLTPELMNLLVDIEKLQK
jgi:enoyl-[acyl-carrier protein] reductase I